MVTETITAVCEMIKSFFGFRQADIEHKPTTQLVKDKNILKKGTNYAEQIIEITDKYIKYFCQKDLRKYNSLKKKFEKNN